ncbi:PEP-CTERM sorting domain-containing protein, partial [Escherichia coli]|uniref:PEP-CTERM sorting domain-containing protein n=1 Tax=Escherichia coli TaxID=562 RepID=UPI0028DD6716
SLLVSLGSESHSTSSVTLNQGGFSGWSTLTTITFTATSQIELLSFLAQGMPNGEPPMALHDGVSIATVPEPSSLVLFGLGAVGLGVARVR